MPSTSWFGPSITFGFEVVAPQDRQGDMAQLDFGNWGDLKRHVFTTLKTFPCPSCGCQRVSGSGVIVRVGKVHLYQQVPTKGWFGRVKYKEKFQRTVWRLHEITLYTAPGRHIFNFFGVLDASPGVLNCNAKGCSWRETGGREGTQTLGEFINRFKT